MMQRTVSATLFSLALACGPVVAQTDAGAYLAARQASLTSDYATATRYYAQALSRDGGNPELLENAAVAYLGLGDVERAAPIARRLLQTGTESQIANLILLGSEAAEGEWDNVLADLDAGLSVGPLYDGLVRAWALVGAGRMSEALNVFDAMAETRGVEAFGLYHKALALASVGDLEGADAILGDEEGSPIQPTRRGIIAHASILGHLERSSEAIALVDEVFGEDLDPALLELRDALESEDVAALPLLTNPAEGLAEVHFSIAGALSSEATPSYTLLFSRMAMHLDPNHIDAVLQSAEFLETLENYELAVDVYDTVPRSHPSFYAAELGRAVALRRSGREFAAIEVLKALSESHGGIAEVHVSLGDMLRRMERYDEATPAYDRAIQMYGDPLVSHWPVYFARGITHERGGRWRAAESDFRLALELRPDQPQVLNYLGYSFVEMQENLDEALNMIERAVELEPNSGFITDSLGWVLYRLGRYEEAVTPMERAVELEPLDPIINDHLGDVYWAVGRIREAEFQWARALSLDPEPGDAERMRRKLEVGLDEVLIEEGADPVTVANDDG